MRCLLIDNYDSYTFNLWHLLCAANGGAWAVAAPALLTAALQSPLSLCTTTR